MSHTVGTLQAPTKPCHNCRRRRLRCDRSVPGCHKCSTTGQECLGYGKLYKWTSGVAARGKRANPSASPGTFFTTNTTAGTTGTITPVSSSTATPASGLLLGGGDADATLIDEEDSSSLSSPSTPNQLVLASHFAASGTLPPTTWTLVDPLFQDVAYPYRHYLSYFTQRVCRDLVALDVPDRNPFRSLIPLTKSSPLLQHIIVAASAAHLSNLYRPPLVPPALATGKAIVAGSPEASRKAFMDALVAKQRALVLLKEALQNIEAVGTDVVLAAVYFFINVELIESGKHGWRAHLQGAGRIMTFLPPTDPSNEFLRDHILSDCFIYYILASAFMPTTPAESSYFQPAQISSILWRTATNNYICCPPELLGILLAAARLSNLSVPEEASAETVTQGALDLLEQAQSYELESWANNVRSVPYLQPVLIENRKHVGSAHRFASCLYIIQAVPSVVPHLPEGAAEMFKRDIVYHLSSIPDDDPNFKATTFPTFIAGAEARDVEQQAWVMDRLQRLHVISPWGFITTAMDTLPVIWGLKGQDEQVGSWVQTLKDPAMNFLIV